jgi:2-polyprenyl-6-methoxyphenol hydroxylase-like FAD-dependent oxidoreductase
MRVLIIGGGIGGPALATFLSRQGADVVLIDKTSEWRDIGFGLTLWGNGRKVLRELGVDAELAKHGYEVPFIRAFSINGKQTWQDLQFGNFKDFGGPVLIVPRAKLHELILEAMPRNVEVRLGTSIENLNQLGNEVEVTFMGGIKEKFDLVVGADGVASHTRELLFGKNDIREYGWRFWVFWMPPGAPIDPYAFSVSGTDKAMGFWPLGEKGFVGMGQIGKDAAKADPQSLLNFFTPFLKNRGWTDDHFSSVLQNAGHDFFDEVRYIKMGRWYKERVALLGDARHAFAPIIGQGASLALEDAYVLSEEIKRFGKDNISQALVAYVNRRNGRVRRMRALSAFIETWANVQNPMLVRLRDTMGPWIPKTILISPLKGLLREKI